MASKWSKRFLKMAELVSTWSKDPSTQVGCVIVDKDKKVLSLGYNGLPKGVDDSDEILHNRDKKYKVVIHAEVNAVLNAKSSLQNSTIYLTHPPCSNCMSVLIQSGISKVICIKPSDDIKERYKDSYALSEMMRYSVGMTYIEFDKNILKDD